MKTLITRLLELDSCKNIHEREQLVLQHVTDDTMKHLLPLLNDILVLKVFESYSFNVISGTLYIINCMLYNSSQFPQTQATMHMHSAERTKGLHKLLFNIVHQVSIKLTTQHS